MSLDAGDDRTPDSAAAALAFCLQVLGIPADPAALLYESGKARLEVVDLIAIARRFNVKARQVSTTLERLKTTPAPALARLRDLGWVLVGGADAERVLLQVPGEDRPRTLTPAEFARIWDGQILLMARRAALDDPYQRFGILWFVAAIRKYRRPLGEVLIGSFFVQLFALLTPLFFQVIIDKVFVHRGLSTLEVLAIGMATLGVFEVVLGAFGPISWPTPPTGLTWSWGRDCSATCSPCPWPISRPGGWATRSQGCVSWTTSASS